MKSPRQIVVGKAHAARTLWRMYRYAANWREVWEAYRSGSSASVIQLRNGLLIRHAQGDIPHLIMYEVFGQQIYDCEPPPAKAAMLDLGANVGYASLYWLRRGRDLQVYAYEPNAEACRLLRTNLQANGYGHTYVYGEAVAGTAGFKPLNVTFPTVNSSLLSLDQNRYPSRPMLVPVVTLREAMARVQQPDIWLLKIDIEGAEADALESVSPAELQRVRNVICEYHDSLAADARRRCEACLRAAGFQLRVEPIDATTGVIRARR